MATRLTGRVSLLLLAFAVVTLIFPAMAFAQAAPTIQSDKDDYKPGETVTLTGSNWQPGEAVHINVNDDQGKTWSRDVDVTANATGQIQEQFQLPSTFVAVYKVTATGAQSGVATTSFTDGNVSLLLATDSASVSGSWSVDYRIYDSTNCTGTFTTGTAAGGTNVGAGNKWFQATNVTPPQATASRAGPLLPAGVRHLATARA